MDSIAAVKEALRRSEISFLENEPMAAHTTFHIGGPAALFLRPESEDEMVCALRVLRRFEIPTTVIGRGSNLLVADEGYSGAILTTEGVADVAFSENIVTVSCGASVTALAAAARDRALSGMEFLYGIPGSVAGAVYMNAGAYGGQVSDILTESRFYDCATDSVGTVCGAAHDFSYRHSIYHNYPDRIILSATFALRSGDAAEIRATMDDLMLRRKTKQPLEYPSAGSVFKRPEGYFAGQLIEECGLKGRSVGGAQVSEKHAGFIVNRGGATAADVLRLIDIIKEEVFRTFGVVLKCELIYLAS